MYVFNIEDEEFVIKPMNCPGHIQIYKSKMRSYRDLPLRFAEFGTVYRYEKSGVLHGMLRVRGFTQDDAHLFCTRDQVYDEISEPARSGAVRHEELRLRQVPVELSVRDRTKKENYAGTEEDWELAEGALVEAMKAKGMNWTRMEGEAVFYGPKIDVKLIDAIGRPWQLSTVQFDFTLPKRFDLALSDPDGQPHQPVMLHRALLGSVERFHGSADRALCRSVSDLAGARAGDGDPHRRTASCSMRGRCWNALTAAGLRVELDDRNEKMGYKIREAQTQKVPYMLVVGDKEVQSGQVSVRNRFQGDEGAQPLESFMDKIKGID